MRRVFFVLLAMMAVLLACSGDQPVAGGGALPGDTAGGETDVTDAAADAGDASDAADAGSVDAADAGDASDSG